MVTHLVRTFAVAAGIGVVAGAARAQLVTPRTVPVFQNQQFDILPSALAGMGGVAIALDDSLPDAFVNPAKAARIRVGSMFAAPFRHGITGDRGGGRTLPLGGMGASGAWTFGGTFALQQLDRGGVMSWAANNSDRTATNQYLSLTTARRLPRGVSVGASASFSALNAVDGVDLLYGGSDRILQSGSTADVRVGLTKDFDRGASLDVILLHNRFEMTHDVHFTNTVWDQGLRRPITTERSEVNDDRTNIWGAHAEFTKPVGNDGWRIGWIGTVNALSHPKIPNYVLQNIPRDPGSTVGVNAGIGVARVRGGVTVGADLILEPMWANTWADAAKDTTIAGGGIIRAGFKTVENDFRFSNTLLRIGAAREFAIGKDSASRLGVQLGLGLYSINYTLGQQNNVLRTFRTQKESWMEWTPTFGLSWRSKGMTVHFAAQSTCGGSDCMTFGDRVEVVSPASGGDRTTTSTIIAAPSSALRFNGGTASSKKIWVSLPVR